MRYPERSVRLAAIVPLLLLGLAAGACRTAPARPSAAGAGTVPASSARVVVHVAFRDVPLPSARVSWYRPDGFPAASPFQAGVSGADGASTAELPPEKYFLVAEWRQDGDFARPIAPGDRFAWFGGNPVFAARGKTREIFVSLEEFELPSGPADLPPGGGGVAGVVVSGGEPVPGAHVFAYLRPQGGFRDIGFAASAPADGNGAFFLDLPPGRYYILARRRAGGALVGPLRKGDHFGYYPANPVEVSAGAVVRVVLPAGRLKARNIPAYSGDYPAGAYLEGRILDRRGLPREGVYAALYDSPELLNRPVFLSEATGRDGRYRLPVPAPGRYYLGARSGYGGSPMPGDFYGRYEGDPTHAIDVKEGDLLRGLDIVVDEVR